MIQDLLDLIGDFAGDRPQRNQVSFLRFNKVAGETTVERYLRNTETGKIIPKKLINNCWKAIYDVRCPYQRLILRTAAEMVTADKLLSHPYLFTNVSRLVKKRLPVHNWIFWDNFYEEMKYLGIFDLKTTLLLI